jgi:RND family efflux transporter MFP subunit
VIKAKSNSELLLLQAKSNEQKALLSEAELARAQANSDSVSLNSLAEKQGAAIASRSEASRANLESKLARQMVDSFESQAKSLQRSTEAIAAAVSLVQGEGQQPDLPIGRIQLRAAIDGVVTARHISAGQGIEANATLVQVVDYSEVQIHGELPESEVDRLGKPSSQAVRIYLSNPDAPAATGTLKFISSEVDQMKRTLHAIIIANNKDGSLRDGMYVNLAVVLREQKQAVVIPPSAILQDGPANYVFIKVGQMFQRKEITPGARSDRFVEIKKGLVPGDIIVTQGAYSVSQLRGTSSTPAKP